MVLFFLVIIKMKIFFIKSRIITGKLADPLTIKCTIPGIVYLLYLIAVCCLFQMEACRIVASVHALQDIPDLPVSDPPKITKDKILIPFPDPFENNEARNPAALSFLFLILFLLIGYDRRKCPVISGITKLRQRSSFSLYRK